MIENDTLTKKQKLQARVMEFYFGSFYAVEVAGGILSEEEYAQMSNRLTDSIDHTFATDKAVEFAPAITEENVRLYFVHLFEQMSAIKKELDSFEEPEVN